MTPLGRELRRTSGEKLCDRCLEPLPPGKSRCPRCNVRAVTPNAGLILGGILGAMLLIVIMVAVFTAAKPVSRPPEPQPEQPARGIPDPPKPALGT